jgi:hypothetical protein
LLTLDSIALLKLEDCSVPVDEFNRPLCGPSIPPLPIRRPVWSLVLAASEQGEARYSLKTAFSVIGNDLLDQCSTESLQQFDERLRLPWRLL